MPSRFLTLGFSAALAVVSLLTLPAYYSAPKQPYRRAIRYLEGSRAPQRDVIVVFPAVGGFRYYLEREGVDTTAYHFVTTMADYDSALVSSSGGEVLVTTLPRVLRSTTPPLAAKVENDWVPFQSFRGTLGDGSITLWRKRPL